MELNLYMEYQARHNYEKRYGRKIFPLSGKQYRDPRWCNSDRYFSQAVGRFIVGKKDFAEGARLTQWEP